MLGLLHPPDHRRNRAIGRVPLAFGRLAGCRLCRVVQAGRGDGERDDHVILPLIGLRSGGDRRGYRPVLADRHFLRHCAGRLVGGAESAWGGCCYGPAGCRPRQWRCICRSPTRLANIWTRRYTTDRGLRRGHGRCGLHHPRLTGTLLGRVHRHAYALLYSLAAIALRTVGGLSGFLAECLG